MNGQPSDFLMGASEHRLVSCIEKELDNDENAPLLKHPRVRSLPDMLLRHGLLQVTVFLAAKGQEPQTRDEEGSPDKERARADKRLLHTLQAALDTLSEEKAPRDANGLAELGEQQPGEYLYLNELAIQAATWIQRLTAARRVVADAADAQGKEP